MCDRHTEKGIHRGTPLLYKMSTKSLDAKEIFYAKKIANVFSLPGT